MLSYRHSFHAGNHADVLKHIVLVSMLEYLTQKDKPLDYIDTHSGAGFYSLTHSHANKTQEFQGGIGRLIEQDWPEVAAYLEVIKACQDGRQLAHYPGSPEIAHRLLRPHDRRWLFELHTQDATLLEARYQGLRHTRVQQADGLKGLLALLPPVSRRALVLIDPSYEIKEDYVAVTHTLKKAWSKFPTGVYALWYPVVDRDKITALESRLQKAGIPSIQRFELGILSDSNERGMTGSGMIVINPPWTLFAQMEQLLPKLSKLLGDADQGSFRCEQLVKE